MASTTTNIGLTKPAGTDQALISAINGNMDIIDTKMGAVGNTSVQSQITSLSDQIANLPPVTVGGESAQGNVALRYKSVNFGNTSVEVEFYNSVFICLERNNNKYIAIANQNGTVTPVDVTSTAITASVSSSGNKRILTLTNSVSTYYQGFVIGT